MGKRFLRLVFLALLALAAGGAAALWLAESRPPSPLVLEHFRVPVRGYSLAVTVVRPRGHGPFGVVVLNHGVGSTWADRHRESPALLMSSAVAFAQRGYAVVMPLRRGFGETAGEFAENPGSCTHPDFGHGEQAAAQDVLAAYAFAQTLPYVDEKRMILAGQSAGGVVSLWAAAQSPPGLQAVLAFAAGRGADPDGVPGVPCAPAGVAAVFEQAGRSVKVPVLLAYSQNDLFFGPATARAWFSRFEAGGGSAEFVLQPAFHTNGHFLFSDPTGVSVWLPQVENFLRRHRIPFDPPKQKA